MQAQHPEHLEPATREFVLAVLRDDYRQLCQYDPEVDPGFELTFDTTVEEWRAVCSLLPWHRMGRAINEELGINCSDEELHEALEPATRRTLRDVCTLIALHLNIVKVGPARLLGCSCLSAGAFLAVRSLLCKAGADPSEIRPSAALAPFTRRYPSIFLGPVSRLAPGALPPVRIRNPVWDAGMVGSLIGLVCVAAGGCPLDGSLLGGGWLLVAGIVTALFSYALTWIGARWVGPSSVMFGELKTFRDLALRIARATGGNPECTRHQA